MQFYATAEEEALALRRAAARAGCTLRSVEIRQTAGGRRAVGNVVCRDGWAAARMLVALAAEDARTPGARDLALSLRQHARSDEDFARAVHEYVKSRVAFTREAGEVFQGSAYTLDMGAGDCDDHARVVYALARAGGVPAVMAFLHRGRQGEGPTHAVSQICAPHCAWAETTVAADYGEHPLAAAERLGLLRARGDLAREVRIMSEKDLAAVPMGFVANNPWSRVADDADVLARLGYLAEWWPESETNARADDPCFRRSVAAFQRAHGGLVVDGLIGPKTRAALAAQLQQTNQAMGDAFVSSYVAANAAPKLTSDIPDAFFVELKRLARDLQTQPEYLLEIMSSESNIKPSAAFRQPHPSPHMATGLIGFVGIRDLGFNVVPRVPSPPATKDEKIIADRENHNAFAKLSHVDQLHYARKYWWALRGKIKDAMWLYQYGFVPLSIARGTDDDTVILQKGGSGNTYPDRSYGGQEAMMYELNKGVDRDNDGKITVADLRAFKNREEGPKVARFQEALARLAAAPEPTGAPPPPPTGLPTAGAGSAVAILLGLGIAAAAAAAAYRVWG